ncbi:MAG: hypothetical protein Q4E62_07830 [Sutterellaceae bacterium]|nr:hypothetical protein [Sutterellaceae bacterium]
MYKTKHIQKRMSQRGIKQKMLELTQNFGARRGDKTVLDRKGMDNLLRYLEELRRDVNKAYERGGFVVVSSDDGTLITAYGMDC